MNKINRKTDDYYFNMDFVFKNLDRLITTIESYEKNYNDSIRLKKFYKIILKQLAERGKIPVADPSFSIELPEEQQSVPWKDIIGNVNMFKDYYQRLKSETVQLSEERVYVSSDVASQEKRISNVIDFDGKFRQLLLQVYNITEGFEVKSKANADHIVKLTKYVDIITSNITNDIKAELLSGVVAADQMDDYLRKKLEMVSRNNAIKLMGSKKLERTTNNVISNYTDIKGIGMMEPSIESLNTKVVRDNITDDAVIHQIEKTHLDNDIKHLENENLKYIIKSLEDRLEEPSLMGFVVSNMKPDVNNITNHTLTQTSPLVVLNNPQQLPSIPITTPNLIPPFPFVPSAPPFNKNIFNPDVGVDSLAKTIVGIKDNRQDIQNTPTTQNSVLMPINNVTTLNPIVNSFNNTNSPQPQGLSSYDYLNSRLGGNFPKTLNTMQLPLNMTDQFRGQQNHDAGNTPQLLIPPLPNMLPIQRIDEQQDIEENSISEKYMMAGNEEGVNDDSLLNTTFPMRETTDYSVEKNSDIADDNFLQIKTNIKSTNNLNREAQDLIKELHKDDYINSEESPSIIDALQNNLHKLDQEFFQIKNELISNLF
jgi:hypothetical protein